jgi:16S rRNA (guanine1207-N2)-methyltransferase
MLPARLLLDTLQLAVDNQVLILNSAADSFVPVIARQLSAGAITLAEDNIAALQSARSALKQEHSARKQNFEHVPLHKYISHYPAATMDVAIMNLLYQPGNSWIAYGLRVAAYALKPGGHLYVVGAKDRGVLSVAKHMRAHFGNVETLAISKGQRVVRSTREARQTPDDALLGRAAFASGKLDEGTQLLLEALEVHTTDIALDIGCGAGFIGLHIARLARKGFVTMVDASLVAVDAAQHTIAESGLTNIKVLPSDGAQAVLAQRFDLVVTNPPFHLGGMQTTRVAERFICEAAQVLRPRGRFYLVANRFLKYEPAMRASFRVVEEIKGNTRYKVLRARTS